MGRFGKALDNPINWSFRVGRLFGIDIRVHIVFVICALVLVSMEMPKAGAASMPLSKVLTGALGTYAILFFIVLAHEFGHCYGARRTGGSADEILLWPLGGLAMVAPPHNPRAHMITTIAGPMVNVIFCLVAAVALVLWTGRLGGVPWNPLNPIWPVDSTIHPTTGQLWLMRFFGLSYILLLFNMLPVFPFDGGRVVQAWLWPRKGYERSLEIATGTGMVGAICLGLFAIFTGQVWLLLMLAIFGYFTCWRMRQELRMGAYREGGEFGYDFSQGYTSLDRGFDESQSKPGFFDRRRAKKAAAQAGRDRQREEEHQREVERILKKVSTDGIASVTAKERRFLQKETERKRAGR